MRDGSVPLRTQIVVDDVIRRAYQAALEGYPVNGYADVVGTCKALGVRLDPKRRKRHKPLKIR